jgi:hypothetical protein
MKIYWYYACVVCCCKCACAMELATILDFDLVVAFAAKNSMTYKLDKAARAAHMCQLVCVSRILFPGHAILAKKKEQFLGKVSFLRDVVMKLHVEEQYRDRGLGRALLLSSFYVMALNSENSVLKIEWVPLSCSPKGLDQVNLEKFYHTFGAKEEENSQEEYPLVMFREVRTMCT